MRAIDTNLLARYIVRDDDVQTIVAEQTIAAGVLVVPTVLLEFAWLLESRYDFPRAAVKEALQVIIDLDSVHLIDPAGVGWAITASPRAPTSPT